MAAGEQVFDMGLDGIGEVGDRASEGQTAGVYGTGFAPGCLAGIGSINRLGVEDRVWFWQEIARG